MSIRPYRNTRKSIATTSLTGKPNNRKVDTMKRIIRSVAIGLGLVLPASVQAYNVDLKNCHVLYAKLNHEIFNAWAGLTKEGGELQKRFFMNVKARVPMRT